jgi:hypothetical protein
MTRSQLRSLAVSSLITCGLTLPLVTLADIQAPGLPKPLGPINLAQMSGRVVRAVMGVSGAIALIMFIYGGVQWMTAAGNAEKTKKAQNTLIWSVIGLVAIFGSYTLLNFILNAI